MQAFEYQEAIFASSLSSKAKLLALGIAYHYNWKLGSPSFPSIKTLSARTGLSKATIHRAKLELIRSGYLQQVRKFNDSNRYLPVIPTQSQIETLVVSHRRTNNEYNNEINNEEMAANAALGINNNISQDEYWRIFDEEERYSRRHAAGGSNKVTGRGNKKPRRNNQDSTGIAGISEESISRQEEYRVG